MKPSLNCNLNMPYPEIRCAEKNPRTALLLSASFAGPHGELTAILTYMRQNIIFADENNTIAAIFECISLTEMRHFHQLGKMIHMLGGIHPIRRGGAPPHASLQRKLYSYGHRNLN